MKAYTYIVTHIPSNRCYYGSRKSSTFDLFKSYFTSSKLIKRLIEEEGVENFTYELRRIFPSYEKARLWETKFLRKVNAVTNNKFFNQAISAPRICSKDSVSEQIRRRKISASMVKRWTNEEYRNKFQTEEIKSHLRRIGLLSSKNKGKKRGRKKTIYKKIVITRNDETKSIFQNQFSAYAKLGWKLAD